MNIKIRGKERIKGNEYIRVKEHKLEDLDDDIRKEIETDMEMSRNDPLCDSCGDASCISFKYDGKTSKMCSAVLTKTHVKCDVIRFCFVEEDGSHSLTLEVTPDEALHMSMILSEVVNLWLTSIPAYKKFKDTCQL